MEASQTWNGPGTSSMMKDIATVAANHLSSFTRLTPTDNNDTNKDNNNKDNSGSKNSLAMTAPSTIKRDIGANLGNLHRLHHLLC